MNIESSRARYDGDELIESQAAADPFVQMRAWLERAYQTTSIEEPNAMCVATCGADGQPSARMVLLRGFDERGLIFYTSYDSRKGIQLSENARAAALFYWASLHRQIRVEGTVSRLSDEESDAYFETRPRGHRLSAWASEQSQPVDDRDVLEERMQHFDDRFEGEEVPRPHSWGGFLIVPQRFEFWQGRPNRVHDRLEYERAQASWQRRRLQP